MKILKYVFYISIPLVFAAVVGIYFGYFKYFEELKHGSDEVDAMRWALIGGLFLSPLGLIFGLILDLCAWLIITSNDKQNE